MTSPKLWAGRFAQDTDALVHAFNSSLSFDQRLWPYDIQGSVAHVNMLGKCGIIPLTEAQTIANGLRTLADDLEAGRAALPADAEDVHMAAETLLTQRLGPVAGKLHTARSRNDQVATDLRLYVRDAGADIRVQIAAVQETLLTLARAHVDDLLPGQTHLQHAQPVRLSHHLLAYFWMLARDSERMADALARANVLPLGAGALAGTTFPINRQMVAEELGFARVSENSMDSVSDRDFALEICAALSILMVHLSRLCEELVIWSGPEFGWAVMGDNVTTGSSIMPQKKNPDVAELVRGKTGRVCGDLQTLLMVMKGLPLAYNKDMQEDKEPLFDALDTAGTCLSVLNVMLQNTQFQTARMAQSLRGDFSTATDLADFLVRQGLPFRQAHEVVGKLVGKCVQNGRVLEDLTAEDLTAASPLFADVNPAALVGTQASARCPRKQRRHGPRRRANPTGTGRRVASSFSSGTAESITFATHKHFSFPCEYWIGCRLWHAHGPGRRHQQRIPGRHSIAHGGVRRVLPAGGVTRLADAVAGAGRGAGIRAHGRIWPAGVAVCRADGRAELAPVLRAVFSRSAGGAVLWPASGPGGERTDGGGMGHVCPDRAHQ